MPREIDVTVTEEHHGKRLDKWLSEAIPDMTRSRAQQLLAEGHVSSGERVLTDGALKVKTGFTARMHVPASVPLDLTPSETKIDIIYEDDAMIVVNKPVGMTVHPAPGAGNDTLVHALLSHCGGSLSGIGGVQRPGIVHRIDKDTSGLLVVAKHDVAHQHLAEQLKSRTLKRTYYAWVWGALYPKDGKVDAPIARHPTHRKKMAVVDGGREAVTHYRTRYNIVLKDAVPMMSCLELNLETGRTHQIRVHMNHIGHGLVGDATYGPSTGTRLARLKEKGISLPEETGRFLRGFARQALHAAKLGLIHPVSGEAMQFEAPVPEDLATLENALIALTK